MRIGFLFNHHARHQVGMLIAFELSHRYPQAAA